MEDMPGAKSTPSRGIRIATYNVHDAVGLDGKLASERIAAVLAEIWDWDRVKDAPRSSRYCNVSIHRPCR